MAFPIVPIVVAGATAAIGYFFQENAAKNGRLRQKVDEELLRKRKHREAELERAKVIFNEIEKFLSIMYQSIESALLIKLDDSSEKQIEKDKLAESQIKFDQTYAQWRVKRRLLMPKTARYFGDDFSKRLGNVFIKLETLRDLGASLDAESNSDQIISKIRTDQWNLFVELDEVVGVLIDQMLEKIQNETVGLLA